MSRHKKLPDYTIDIEEEDSALAPLEAMYVRAGNPLATNLDDALGNHKNDPSLDTILKDVHPSLKKFELPMSVIKDDRDRKLNQEQELAKELITTYVRDSLGDKQVKPLRLMVSGYPGSGKTAAMKTAASQLLEDIPALAKHVIFATPTGAVAKSFGYEARTIHSAFQIKVGEKFKKLNKPIGKNISVKLIPGGKNPSDIKLIVFDEFSMISREMEYYIEQRLKYDYGINLKNIGIVWFGDPAQNQPVSGNSIFSLQMFSKSSGKACSQPSKSGLNFFAI